MFNQTLLKDKAQYFTILPQLLHAVDVPRPLCCVAQTTELRFIGTETAALIYLN